jgi:hypothetical protein
VSRKLRLTGGSPSAPPAPNDHTLTIILAGSGGGRVTATGVDTGTGDMTQVFPHGTSVQVSAVPNGSSDLGSWSVSETGNSGTTAPFTLTMNGDRTVTVTFSLTPGGRIVRKGTQEIEFARNLSAGLDWRFDPLDVPARCIRFRIRPSKNSSGVFADIDAQNTRLGLFQAQGIYTYFFMVPDTATDALWVEAVEYMLTKPNLKPVSQGGPIEWYELGNEPSYNSASPPGAAWTNYFRRLYLATPIIHAAGGKVCLCHRLGGPTTRTWLDYARWSELDAVALHRYNLSPAGFAQALRDFRAQVDQWGDPPGGGADKPLLLTEFGWSVYPDTAADPDPQAFRAPHYQPGTTTPYNWGGPSGPVSNEQQASNLEQAFTAMFNMAHEVDCRIIGDFAGQDYGPDGDADPDTGANMNQWSAWCGKMRNDRSRRRSFNRYKALPESRSY